MKEPNPRSSRLALAGGLVAVLVLGGGGFLLGQNSVERPAASAAAVPIPSVKPVEAPTEVAAPRRIMGRADLIALAASAADALAAGRTFGADVGDADGRRFEVRLPFGCNGPAGEGSNAAMRWRYDAKNEALRLHVAPVAWVPEEWWTSDAPPRIQAIEGFWIMRPWTSSEACTVGDDQPAAVDADPVTLPGQTLAIGQIFSADGARRNAKPYQSVIRVPEADLDTSRGFRVRISGRTAGAPNRAVRCQQPVGPEQRPICLIAVVFDEIAIENIATDETLATWSVAQRQSDRN